MSFELSSLDIIVIIFYLVATLLFALYLSRDKGDSEKYFLAGRSLSWPLVGFSLFASNMSGSSFVALAGEGYKRGIAVYNYEWIAAIILIFFLFFILPVYLNHKIYTIPEYLEYRFDKRSRTIFSIFTITANIFIDAAAGLYAGGLVLQMLYPDIPIWIPISLIGVLAGIYTISGGLSAVVITDLIQAIVLIIGASIVSIMTFLKIGSWTEVKNHAPDNSLSLILPSDDPFLPWPGLLTGVLIIGFYFWSTNQFIVQRTLGAKNISHGRWGALLAGFLKLPILFLMILPGTFAISLYPELSSPDLVFPTLTFDLLPVGLRGLVIAALLAAIMSSIDSTLNSASTLVTMDFIRPIKNNLNEHDTVRTGKAVTFVFMILSILWAPQIIRFETLWQYLQSVLSYITPPVVVCILSGIFWKRATSTGSFYTFVIGIPLGIAGFIFNEILGFNIVHFLYACGILFLVCLTIMIVISLKTYETMDISKLKYMWTKELLTNENQELKLVPWYYNYRIQSLVLIILTSVVVVLFW